MTEHSRTLLIPNFCLDRPFGFSVHRDIHFCPSRLFRFSTCRVYRFFFQFHPLFLPEPFWFAGKPLLLPRCVNLAGLCWCVVFFRLYPCSQDVGKCPCCCVAMPPEDVWSGKIRCRNAPSDSGGDLPQAIWHPWEIPLILTGLPQMIDHDHAVPLDWRYFCSQDIHRANFPAVQTKIHMQTKLF